MMRVERTSQGESFRVVPTALVDLKTNKIYMNLSIDRLTARWDTPSHSLKATGSTKLKGYQIESEAITLETDEGPVRLVPLTSEIFNSSVKKTLTPVKDRMTTDAEVQKFFKNYGDQFQF